MSSNLLSGDRHFELITGIPRNEMSDTMHEIGRALGSTTFELAVMGWEDPKPLRIHSESIYHERMCTYFLLGCIEQAEEGGDNTLYDGVEAAKLIKVEAPELLDVRMVYHAEHYKDTKSTIPLVRDLRGGGDALHFRQRYPYNEVQNLPEGWTEDSFYEYVDGVLDRSVELEHRLEPGEVLVVDNYKVLHGRASFKGLRKVIRVRVDDPAYDEWLKINQDASTKPGVVR